MSADEKQDTVPAEQTRTNTLTLAAPSRVKLTKVTQMGQVRQNFGRGRSKTVVVETRHSRIFVGGAAVVNRAPTKKPPEPTPDGKNKTDAPSHTTKRTDPQTLPTVRQKETEKRSQNAQDIGHDRKTQQGGQIAEVRKTRETETRKEPEKLGKTVESHAVRELRKAEETNRDQKASRGKESPEIVRNIESKKTREVGKAEDDKEIRKADTSKTTALRIRETQGLRKTTEGVRKTPEGTQETIANKRSGTTEEAGERRKTERKVEFPVGRGQIRNLDKGTTEQRKAAIRHPSAPPTPTVDNEDASRLRRTTTDVRKDKEGVEDRESRALRRKVTTSRRSAGRLTIEKALGTSEGRHRSEAALRRHREKQLRSLRAQELHTARQKVVREVVVPESIVVQELANRMAERVADVVKFLVCMNVMVTAAQSVDGDTAELVVSEFGHRIKRVAEDDLETSLQTPEDAPEYLRPRPPVVTVMGHVDHGKTTLLDALRKTRVVSSEIGGITQHIGAWQVDIPQRGRLTFIDTPGHAAFSCMRSRGARVTDIVVLVIAAADGVQAQTVEAIAHARSAGVPMVVAINKIDQPGADPKRVKEELLRHEVMTEGMGGDVLTAEISALKGTGLNELCDGLLLQAEVLELKANPDRPAAGTVLESRLERGRGAVASLLVQRGTLRKGNILVAGSESGRVRDLLDERGRSLQIAIPSQPVEVLGLSAPPMAGDSFLVLENETKAREVAAFRREKLREKHLIQGHAAISAVRFPKTEDGKRKEGTEEIFSSAVKRELSLVVKADVQGSLEAVRGCIEKLAEKAVKEVQVKVLLGGVGEVTESDVTFAKSTGARILAFHVRALLKVRELAQRLNVDISFHTIIYEALDAVSEMLSALLDPIRQQKTLGTAEIREVFDFLRMGKVAGCVVREGLLRSGARVRLFRNDSLQYTETLKTLRHFKQEVQEVTSGNECGVLLANQNDVQVGDRIECFEIAEIARKI